MHAARSLKPIFIALGGAVVGAVLWFFVNNMARFDDVGWLSGRDDWWAAWYAWSAIGAVIAVVGEVLQGVKRRRRAEAMARAAQFLGFRYDGAVSGERLSPFLGLPIFQKFQAAENYMTGESGGVAVDVLDYTYREEGSGDSGDRDYRQTVVLLPGGEGWPRFELRPRGFGVRVLNAFGIEGISLDCPGESHRRDYEQFQRRYFLIADPEAIVRGFGQVAGGTSDAELAEHERAVRRAFTPEVVRFFADHPGWRVQSDGRSLVVWRHNRLVSPSALEARVREAVEMRHVLRKSIEQAAPVSQLAAKPHKPGGSPSAADELAPQARAIGSMLGVMIGFFGGGILGGIGAGTIFFSSMGGNPGTANFFLSSLLGAAIFFGGAFGGLAIGAALGGRWLEPLVQGIMARRRDRVLGADPFRPADQPLSSNARWEKSVSGLEINLPPLGLRRAGGTFLFLWCLGWNGMVLLFSAVFLPAAVAGEVLLNDGPETVNPLLAVLFLSPFWAVGLGPLGYFVYKGRRRARVMVDRVELSVHEETLTGCRDLFWRLSEIEDIRVEVDRSWSPPRTRLAVCTGGENPVLLLGHRPYDELQWLAAELRRAASFEKSPALSS